MKCKKLVCGCMVFMLIFGMCACGKKEKAKEAAPDLVLELPKEKEIQRPIQKRRFQEWMRRLKMKTFRKRKEF